MRASVEASLLASALGDIIGVAGRKNEITQCVRIAAKDNSLRLITTNYEIEAHAIVEAATQDAGHACVNARDLLFALKSISGCVDLSLSPNGLSVSCGSALSILPVRSEEFPRLQPPSDMEEIIGGVEAFLTCCSTASKDPARWHLGGVAFNGETAFGTDGKSARFCPVQGGAGRIIPAGAQAIISKLKGQLFVSDRLWRLEQENRTVIGQLLDAGVVDVEKLPHGLPLAWTCDATELRQAIEAASFGRAEYVVLSRSSCGISVAGERFGGAHISATREVSATGNGATIVCSVSSLLAVIKDVKGELHVHTNGSVVEFHAENLRGLSMVIRDNRNTAPAELEAA